MSVNGGDLLIAPAAMKDPRFVHSVILLTHHHADGSYGLCLNRPTGYTIAELLVDSEIECYLNFPVYWGGPVSPGTVWMLHDPDWESTNTVQINDHWAMTSHKDMFLDLAAGSSPRWLRMCHGYTGWAPNQLERELQGSKPWSPESSWLTVNQISPDLVIEQDESELWARTIELSAKQAMDHWL